MSTYTASVRVEDGMLHTMKPLTAPEAVTHLIDRLVYDMADASGPAAAGVTAIEVTIDTAGESDTPIGDSTAGTSSLPIAEPEPDEGLEPGEAVSFPPLPQAAPVVTR